MLRRYGIEKSVSRAVSSDDQCPLGEPDREEGSKKFPERLQTSHTDVTSDVSSSTGDSITPRSKALLDQLKDELLL